MIGWSPVGYGRAAVTMPPRLSQVAVLDMDGTLFPGVVGLALVSCLAAQGLADPGPVEDIGRVARRYEDGELDLVSATTAVYERYASSLAGQAQHQVQQAARECWTGVSGRLFPFSRRLVADLADLGIRSMLISGSPDEVIQVAAQDLRIPYARGAIAETDAGRYTGELASMPAVRDGKSAAVAELARGAGLVPRCVFAIGNSINDAGVFALSVHSVAFEPDRELTALAEGNGWLIADRICLPTLLTTVLSSLRAQQQVGHRRRHTW
ncbi:hypothetical protein GCM10010178_92130 [Lentzea flava]|uniref:Phosphoserine phosphatase n=2 Tax=Lentzea flava TaxID=103732 RepID=A0ABQ2VI70_9PSEU|nr:Phosphoserine phosphatase [Lentzea flava]GGU88050.1 hypothetical protein GCM10010178_92130 [Lentzea flava]